MAELTVDFTYGQALFDAARELNKTDEILSDGEEMAALFKAEPDFLEFVASPTIAHTKKKAVLKNVFENRVAPELINLLFVLVDKGRVRHFERIIRRYKGLLDESRGISFGTIFSAVPLTTEHLHLFEEKTGKLLQKQVRLENKTDAGLIGGAKIFIEGKVIDASMKSRLSALAESLK